MPSTTLPGVLLSGTNAARPAATAVSSGTLYAETDTGQTYQSDGATWSAWGAAAGSVTSSENFMTAAVTMTNANQAYDGPSLSLAAGTYICFYSINILINNATGGYANSRLWDGTTVYHEGSFYGNQFYAGQLAGSATITLGSTTTIKVSAISNSTGNSLQQTTNTNGTANKASNLVALKIA